MARILIITGELTSIPGLPTGGLGVRLEKLADGLRQHGHEPVFSFAEDRITALEKKFGVTIAESLKKHAHRNFFDDIVMAVSPDIIIFSPWLYALDFNNQELLNRIPIVFDIPGLLSLENLYEKNQPPYRFHSDKLIAFNRGDLFCVSNPRQKYYLYPLLTLAGVDLRQQPVRIVPISISSDTEERTEYPSPPVFIFSGVSWEWQDYGNSLEVIAGACAARNGRLKIFSGGFMYSDRADSTSKLGSHPAVDCAGLIDHQQLMRQYLQASAAIELYLPNPERELASTTRTIEYLQTGLPVIYSDGMYLADFIREYDAGWVIPPDDKAALQRVLNEIFASPAICRDKGANAQRLARERFNNLEATRPLAEFCAAPRKLRNRVVYPVTMANIVQAQTEHIKSQLSLLRGKDVELNRKHHELKEKNEYLNNYKARATIMRALLKQLKRREMDLSADLTRIKGRLVFQLLLRLKKFFDALRYLVGLRDHL